MRVTRIALKDLPLVDDERGRCIPSPYTRRRVVKPDERCRLVQPPIEYKETFGRIRKFLPELEFCSAEQFEAKGQDLLHQIQDDERTRALLKGVHLPLVFPKFDVHDYGLVLERVFLEALERSYKEYFPQLCFYNATYQLGGKVNVDRPSRHGELIARMKTGPVVGIFFPNPLQGFSVSAARQMIARFPENYCLSGAIDSAIALIANPDVLAGDAWRPRICTAGISRRGSIKETFHFPHHAQGMDFNAKSFAADYSGSSGILFLGKK
jgi:hypothetical protein